MVFNFRRKKADAPRSKWEIAIVDFLGCLQQHVGQTCGIDLDLDVRTEHKRGSQIFRGHPNFRQTGMWNDWAMFDWGKGYGKLPGEIWCFVDLSEAPANFKTSFAGCNLTPGVYAVMESSKYCTNLDDNGKEINYSEMFTPIVKEMPKPDSDDDENDGQLPDRKFYLANVESIVSTACVTPDIGSDNISRYFLLTPRKDWPKLFTTWLDQPHTHEAEEMKAADMHDKKLEAKQ